MTPGSRLKRCPEAASLDYVRSTTVAGTVWGGGRSRCQRYEDGGLLCGLAPLPIWVLEVASDSAMCCAAGVTILQTYKLGSARMGLEDVA